MGGDMLHDDLMMEFAARGSIHVIMLYGEGKEIITTCLVSHGLRSMIWLVISSPSIDSTPVYGHIARGRGCITSIEKSLLHGPTDDKSL